MNLMRHFRGFLKAIGLSSDWQSFFDLDAQGFQRSFLTIPLSLPFLYLCALSVHQQQVALTELNSDFAGPAPELISPLSFVLISLAFGFSFSALTFILARVFRKQDRYQAWVNVRHWGFFLLIIIASVMLGLTYMKWLPFEAIIPLFFILYLGTLAVDIRLAQKIGGFDWGGAILVGCMITALGLTIVLMGLIHLG